MASVTAEPDSSRSIGYARIIIDGLAQMPEDTSFRIWREGYPTPNLGPRGWQVREERLKPMQMVVEGTQIVLVVSPAVTRFLDVEPYVFALPAAGIEAPLFWPDTIDVFEGDLPPASEPPAEEPVTQLLLSAGNRGVDGHAGKPSTEASPPAATEPPAITPPVATPPTPRSEPKDGAKLPLILAGVAGLMLLVLLAGGAWWFWFRPVDPPPLAAPQGPPSEQIAQIPPNPPAVPPQVTPPPPTPPPTPPAGPILSTPPAAGPPAPTWPAGTDSLTLRDLVQQAPNPAGIHAAALRRQAEGRYDDAFVLFEEAAERGHAEAMTAIGRMYDPNGFVPGRPFSSPDPRSAARFYRDAARAGDSAAGLPRSALRETLDAQAQRGSSSAASALQEFWP